MTWQLLEERRVYAGANRDQVAAAFAIELERLADLHASGRLSDEEFALGKGRLLREAQT